MSLKTIVPELIFSNPTIPYTSSLWPLPSIPAIQTISPALTLNDTLLTVFLDKVFEWIVKFETFKTSLSIFWAFLSITKSTFLIMKELLMKTIKIDAL